MKINSTKIEMLLAKRGMTKTTLAERSGISRQNVSTVIRRGTCEPFTVNKLALGLGVPIEEIIKEE